MILSYHIIIAGKCRGEFKSEEKWTFMWIMCSLLKKDVSRILSESCTEFYANFK